MQMMTNWFALKQQKNFPVLGATDQSGNFLGFATYGIFRERDAYKYTVEHSIYIDHQHQGQGTGKLLMQELINRATAQEYHVMMGVIDAANQPSIKFHEQFGFVPCGLIKQAGYKFNQWLDLALYQLILPTPHAPNEII
jgi:phosphinothricin acetyltransferase